MSRSICLQTLPRRLPFRAKLQGRIRQEIVSVSDIWCGRARAAAFKYFCDGAVLKVTSRSLSFSMRHLQYIFASLRFRDSMICVLWNAFGCMGHLLPRIFGLCRAMGGQLLRVVGILSSPGQHRSCVFLRHSSPGQQLSANLWQLDPPDANGFL